MSRLDLVVGPNGAGKSTFVRLVLGPERPGVPFVNADVVAAREWPEDPSGHAYDAAETAARIRAAMIAAGEPFIAETVFSHPSKLALIDGALRAGYDVRLHVLMVPVELAVHRVALRVHAGGHDVPIDKIRKRHDRLWALVAEAAFRADPASFWANESDGPRQVALFHHGRAIGDIVWPVWVHPDLPTQLGGSVDEAHRGW